MDPAGGFLIVSGIIYSQIFYENNYSMVTQQYGQGTSIKIVAASLGRRRLSAVTCVVKCLEQNACLYSHRTTSTCYLLGTDALIGQDTTYSLQPQDTVYSVYQNAGKCKKTYMRSFTHKSRFRKHFNENMFNGKLELKYSKKVWKL